MSESNSDFNSPTGADKDKQPTIEELEKQLKEHVQKTATETEKKETEKAVRRDLEEKEKK